MKRLLVILTVAMMLTGCFGGEKEKATSSTQENVTAEVQDKGTPDTDESISETKQDAEMEKNKAESKEESSAVLLENEGDIEIIVPDDQAFGGE